jgi:DNA relaxase NicK
MEKTLELYLLQIKRGKKGVAFHTVSLANDSEVKLIESLQKVLRFKVKRIDVAIPQVAQ